MSIINWVKTHKLLVILALIIAYLLQNSPVSPLEPRSRPGLGIQATDEINYSNSGANVGMTAPSAGKSFTGETGFPPQNYQQLSDSSQRIVIKESNLSLLVKNVRETGDKIVNTAKGMGGYMVQINYNNPNEQGYATVSVRVPTDRLDEALNQFRASAVKVTSENLLGTDVTEQYQDLDQNLTTLRATRTKFEEILKKATTVQEILEVNREIISLEQQIDYATGQKMAISDNARLTKITLFLSTDELALPYTPDKVFRPDVIFKLAVRSLLSTVQSFAELVIWAGVYALIWVPILIVFIIIKRRMRPNPKSRLN